MTREIKFRAWDKNRKTMIGSDYPENWDDNKDEYWGDVAQIDLTSIESISKDTNFDVMQYTGLKDKNGVEIYEGDICRVDHQDKRYEPSNEQITWDKYEGWCVGCGSTTEVHWSHEVIGNIYQNPELLDNK